MTFPIHFLISNLFISFLLGLMVLAKKLLRNHITVGAQYGLWYIFVLVLFAPLIPVKILEPEKLLSGVYRLLFPASSGVSLGISANAASKDLFQDGVMEDFSLAVGTPDSLMNTILWSVWIVGMVFGVIYFGYTLCRIYHIRKNAYPVTMQTEPELYSQFCSCADELGITRKGRLYASCSLSTPVSYGWICPRILIPQDFDILLSREEMRFIFLHELQHEKHRDAVLNTVICILQIAYWFNPFVWYAFRLLKSDREIACDYSVIRIIGEEKCGSYGKTLLQYAEKMQKGMFLSPLSTLGGSKSMLRRRIFGIAGYHKPTLSQKAKSLGIILLTLAVAYSSSPLFTAYAFDDTAFFDFENRNWEPLDAGKYFKGMDGSFVLYKVSSGQYQIYNKEQSVQRVSPDSTYKIYSALFALEENIITPDSSLQKWNGEAQPFASWCKDHTLETAMKNSVNWYFKNLDQQMGLPALYSYYNRVGYGNCDLSGGISRYWAEASLKISPVEQVQLLTAFLKNEWDFNPENIQAVKDALLLSEMHQGKLYGKTGTGESDGQRCRGWFVGFYESGRDIYCFAANVHGENNTDGSTAAEIARTILEDEVNREPNIDY